MRNFYLVCILLTACLSAAARRRPLAPVLFPKTGSLLAQNAAADRMGLKRLKNASAMRELVSDGSLVPLPVGSALRSTVPQQRAFLQPFATEQLDSIAQAFFSVFGKPLFVSSAVRPLDVQRRLRWWNRNAAPVKGPTASVHPTGAAFDIGKRSMSREQRRWLEWRLWYLQNIGWAIVEEERACFHVVALRDHDGAPGISDNAMIAPFERMNIGSGNPPALLHRAHSPNVTPDIAASLGQRINMRSATAVNNMLAGNPESTRQAANDSIGSDCSFERFPLCW